MPEDTKSEEPSRGTWPQIINATSSPLRLFALMVLVCDTLFGLAAAATGVERLFIYALHTFLALAASFVMIALWSPRSFYSPRELVEIVKAEREAGPGMKLLPETQPIVPTIVLAAGVLVYAVYQTWN
jgi:hypothetical protein